MWIPLSTRSRRIVRASALAALVAGSGGCTTAPRIAFSGTWTSYLPQGGGVLFYASQTGSRISGTVSNFGPVTEQSFPITGSVTRQGVAIVFSYPAGVSGMQGSPIAWTFHGAFTSATTIEGTITSATGITGSMTITKNNGPIPV